MPKSQSAPSVFQWRGHALALLLQIGEALEVGDGGDLAVHRHDLRHVLGDQVVVLHRRDRQVDAHHAADLARP
jgi:hypothetical protein